MFFVPLFLSNLKTKKIARKIEYIRTTDSTNETIYKMFQNNTIKANNALITDNQTAGKGRRGNTWFSSNGKSLTFSFIIKDDNDLLIKKIPLISGIAIIEAIKKMTNIECQLKWPNDILYNSKKLGGVLIEKKEGHFIVGIGLNVNEASFERSIESKTCSIFSILNHSIQREALLAYIFNNFEALLNQELIEIIKKWESLCNHINTFVKFHNFQNMIEAKFIGLNEKGEARIEIGNNEKIFNSGIIEL